MDLAAIDYFMEIFGYYRVGRDDKEMMCYRDMTFCPYWKSCKDGKNCPRALTAEVEESANKTGLLIDQWCEKPECFKKYILLDVVWKQGMANSKGQAKRLIIQGAIKLNGEIVTKWDSPVSIDDKTERIAKRA
jgi:ribosome-associated protein YbcJ (S4-like RNA binding protein)